MEGQLPPEKAATRPKERPFRGIRMRKWGKWVAEIREPNKRSRIWLGSYCTPVAAAKAYDTALFYLRGRTARLNFPDDISIDDRGTTTDMSAASIRKKAAEVGAKVDALQMNAAALFGSQEDPRQEGETREREREEWKACFRDFGLKRRLYKTLNRYRVSPHADE
ncbi:hypothetical protein B296_00041699 [Ensete ventricosum]|uniref:AP2/ERF domain-containing protein n=1 Tax=Ensete ventricosum TaxID=4639 RepID=A0A426X2D4_ENSVE|nr:hypothetical protein B296_00041699 [Ensete ventricosum]